MPCSEKIVRGFYSTIQKSGLLDYNIATLIVQNGLQVGYSLVQACQRSRIFCYLVQGLANSLNILPTKGSCFIIVQAL